MKESLKQYREKWEKTLLVKSVLDIDEYKTVVILENEKTDTYYIHRYFLMGGEWACSVDKSGISLDEVFDNLEWQIK